MNSETHRIEVSGRGIGEVSDDLIRQRANELARIDGRPSYNHGDLAKAEAELRGVRPSFPEESLETQNLAQWDEAPGSSGRHAPVVRPENDENLSEDLIREGLDEAEHDSRVQASKEPY